MRRGFRRWASAAADCKSYEKYFLMVDGLRFLHSPNGLADRAQLCMDVCEDIFDVLHDAGSPQEALDAIDTVNNAMCLLLDPAEAIRNVHPDSVYRQVATTAFNTVYKTMSQLNTSERLYNVVDDLSQPDVLRTLTPVQRQNVLMLQSEMDSGGKGLDERGRDLLSRLTAEKERLAHELTEAAGTADEQRVLEELLTARYHLAALLKRDCYADWVMETSLAGCRSNAIDFLNCLSRLHMPKALREKDMLLALKRNLLSNKDKASPSLLDYEQKALMTIHKERKYGPAIDKLSEYLTVGNAWRGLALICERLFNVSMVNCTAEMEPYERYHESVQKYVLYDGTNEVLGTIYADLLERPDKMQGAGQFTLQLGTNLHIDVLDKIGVEIRNGGKQRPVVVFSCNAKGVEKGGGWEGVIMRPEELTVMYHEFGHALHTVFGQQDYQNLCGTRSSLDYVEVFSQVFEYFSKDFRVLQAFASHYRTGEPVPQDLVAQLHECEDSFKALDALDQLILASADLTLHGPLPFTVTSPTNTHHPCTLDTLIPTLSSLHTPTISTSYSLKQSYSIHHMSNYPAGYYAYPYSKVIAASIWNKYFNQDPWCPNGGAALRSIMSLGASMKPQEMLRTCFDVTDPRKMLDGLEL